MELTKAELKYLSELAENDMAVIGDDRAETYGVDLDALILKLRALKSS